MLNFMTEKLYLKENGMTEQTLNFSGLFIYKKQF